MYSLFIQQTQQSLSDLWTERDWKEKRFEFKEIDVLNERDF